MFPLTLLSACRRPGGRPGSGRLSPGLMTLALLALALVLASPAGAGSASGASPRFVDLVDHPAPEANWDRFHDLEDRLSGAFLAACGKGACVPRRFLWPMQLRCSVRVGEGSIAACIWVVAGSDLRVRAAGSIDPDVVIWRCVLPVPAGLAVDAFHAALDVADPLQVRLPGAAMSLMQGLRECLDTPGTRS